MKLSTSFVYGLIACIVLVSAPHAEYLPWWVSVLCAVLLAWRCYLNYAAAALPPRWLLLGLTAASAAGVLLSFHTLLGREAGVTLLILLSSLKLLELRSMRDAVVLIYLSSFIIITNFLNSQSIPTAVLMMISMLVIVTTWVQMHTGALAFKPRLFMGVKLLLQALPLTLLLFVLFPRVQGPLWGMPQDGHASSGLSDSMAPGTLSKLSLSQAVAFRVNFEGQPPPREQMYWRGPVLWDFDGVTWKAREGAKKDNMAKLRGKTPQLDHLERPLDYTVTLEPSNKPWLFALEFPTRLSVPYLMTDDFQTHSKDPVNSRLRYTAHSQLGFRVNIEEAGHQLQRALALPGSLNPRARALAAEWRANLPDEDAIVRTAITRFNQENFIYTLEPPLLGSDSVDEFLFETRKGFCEHYASSFVFLMRAAGIPARVVTGYQGGEPNAYGNYTIVRQADAHAWAEVWVKGRGWLRLDPTAAIAPERIQSGLSAAMPDSAALPFLARRQASWLLNIRFNLDLLNHQWNQWVLGYDTERQFSFLTRLGMEDITWQKMAINLLLGMVLLVGLLALLLLHRLYKRHTDQAQALYLKFCRKLARSGIVRAAHEGAKDFALRAALSKPEQAAAIDNITRLYLQLRYTGEADRENLLALRRAVATFSA